MTHDAFIIALILLVNAVVALVYLLVGLVVRDIRHRVTGFVVMLAFPLVGAAIIGGGRLVQALLRIAGRKVVDLDELSFDKRRMQLAVPADIRKGLNTVPVEEALIMADAASRRQSFIDVLKADDQGDMMPVIRRSVENADPEIAHYAASFVASAAVSFKNQEAALYERLRKDASPERLRAYVTHVEDMVSSHLFANVEMEGYMWRLLQAAEMLYQADPDAMSDVELVRLVEAMGTMGMDAQRNTWVERARPRAWTSLVCFKLCAGYYFEQGDRASLFKLLDEARNHSVLLDKEALEWLRMIKTEELP